MREEKWREEGGVEERRVGEEAGKAAREEGAEDKLRVAIALSLSLSPSMGLECV